MKQYFVPAYGGDPAELAELAELTPSPIRLYAEDTKPQPKATLTVGEDAFCLLPEVETKTANIVGYLLAEKREGRRQLYGCDCVAQLRHGKAHTLVTKRTEGKVVGYLQTETENQYVAVTILPPFIPVIPLIFLLAIIFTVFWVLVYYLWVPDALPTSVSGDSLTDGGITPTISAQLDPAYFNVKINATPILKDGSMNLRIENSERNLYNCIVDVEISNGETVETIYSSPLIPPNKALEHATIEMEYPTGVYDGKAIFKIYAEDGTLLGNTTVKLIINIL